MRRGHVIPVWKASSLATLSRGNMISNVFPSSWDFSKADSVKDLEKSARKMQVLLGPNEVSDRAKLMDEQGYVSRDSYT